MKQLSIDKMPTSITADNYPIHKWFNFVAGYAPEYVDCVINEFRAKNGYYPCKIYDPFAGCATTNVVANSYNIPSIGIERNPFFYKIGYAKANAYKVYSELNLIEQEFMQVLNTNNNAKLTDTLSKDAKIFLSKLFDEDILESLLVLREQSKKYKDAKYTTAFVFISKMLEFVTHAKTDGIYKVPTSIKQHLSIYQAIEKTKTIIKDGDMKFIEQNSYCDYIFDSSVDYVVEKDSLDMVVFSPPYLNNFDFAEMTRMQMYFWEDAGSWAEISSKHRNHMLINTTTALKLVRTPEEQFKMKNLLPKLLQDKTEILVKQLADIRKEKPSKKEYYLLIYPYLSQMNTVLKKCYEGLRINGEIHIVVSDAAFYGIHIDTQEFLKDLLLDIGFLNVQILQMRTRGDRWILEKRKSSGKQLGEYEIIGVKG